MKRFLATCFLLSMYSMLSSCNIMAIAKYITSPDPEQEAIFTLPDVPTVVFVDDRRNVMHPARLRRIIADKVTDELLANKLVKVMISPRDAMRVSATNDKYNEPLPINRIGSEVGASVVIYIEMTAFGLTSDGHTATPRTSCGIRVIDVEHKTRLFPIDTSSFAVSQSMKYVGPNRVTSSADARKLAEELALKLADSIAKVFYTHNIGRLGENLDRK